MTRRWIVPVAGAVLLGVLALTAAGCGGSSSKSGGGSSAATTTGGKSIKVGLVTDIGGLNDRSFNHLAYVGLQRAQSELGVKGRVLQSHSNGDYVPNLSTLAQQHYDLVIGVGFLMGDAIDTVAQKFPNVKFAIIDFPWEALKHKPKNVEGLLFKTEQAGYLVGYLSGLMEKQNASGKNTIGVVGGQKLPSVDSYIAGYQTGAKAAAPGIKVLLGYSQSFTDPAKCKEIALNQIAQGSDIEFQVAGGCGLGVLDAAKEKGVSGIGVDADQAYIGPQVLTSAVKKVDVSVFDTAKAVQSDSFKGAKDEFFTVANNGTGIGTISSKVPQNIVSKVRGIEQEISSGKLSNIPSTVK